MRSGRWVCVLGLAGLVGCGPRMPSGPVCDAGGDVVAEASPSGPPPREFVLALSSVVIDTTDDPTVPVFGFNLDGYFSVGERQEECFDQDSPSSYDLDQNGPRLRVTDSCPMDARAAQGCTVLASPAPDALGAGGACTGGVDNRASVLANTVDTVASPVPGGVRAALVSHFAQQRGTVLVRVAGVNGEPGPALEDSEIEVQIGAAVPAFTSECEASGASREYALLRSSLREGGTSLRDALFSARGRIRAGRVEIVAEAGAILRFDVGASVHLGPLGFGPAAPDMNAVHLRFDLGADGSGSRGNFGAYLPAAQVIQRATAIPGPSGTRASSLRCWAVSSTSRSTACAQRRPRCSATAASAWATA